MGNSFAVPKGDQLYIATPTVAQVRSVYTENGGWLSPAMRRFLRRFVIRYSNGSGTSKQIVIAMPKKTTLEKLQQLVAAGKLTEGEATTFINQFEPFDDALANNPWIGDPAYSQDPGELDTEFGSEYETVYEKLNWGQSEEEPA